MRMLLDTSVLVRLRDADSPLHTPCIDAIEKLFAQSVQICLCLQVLIEFWSVCTRPRSVNGMGLSPEEAYRDCQRFLTAFSLLEEPVGIADEWLKLVQKYSVQGKQVHDARLAAFAIAHEVDSVLTLNPEDFVRYTEIKVVTPHEVLQ